MMPKVIKLSNTQIETRLVHARRSMLYFAKNFLKDFNPSPFQETLIKKIEKELKEKNDV